MTAERRLARDERTRGEMLFAREWVPNDPMAPAGDGLGPVYNESSCVACHGLGSPGGAGPENKNVVLLTANPVGRRGPKISIRSTPACAARSLPWFIVTGPIRNMRPGARDFTNRAPGSRQTHVQARAATPLKRDIQAIRRASRLKQPASRTGCACPNPQERQFDPFREEHAGVVRLGPHRRDSA